MSLHGRDADQPGLRQPAEPGLIVRDGFLGALRRASSQGTEDRVLVGEQRAVQARRERRSRARNKDDPHGPREVGADPGQPVPGVRRLGVALFRLVQRDSGDGISNGDDEAGLSWYGRRTKRQCYFAFFLFLVAPPRPRNVVPDSASTRCTKPYERPLLVASSRMLRPLSYCLRRSVASFVRSAPVIRTPFFSAAICHSLPNRPQAAPLRGSPHVLISAHLRSRKIRFVRNADRNDRR